MAESYAHVAVSASGVVPAPIEAVWSLVRVFSSIGQWMVQDGFVSFTSELLVRAWVLLCLQLVEGLQCALPAHGARTL